MSAVADSPGPTPRRRFGRMHPLLLRFDVADMEMRFQQSWRSVARPTNRAWAGAALVAYLLMFAVLYRLDPAYATQDQWFRLYVCFPALTLEVVLAWRRTGYTRLYQALYLFTSLCALGNAAISHYLAPEHLCYFFLLELALIFVFCGNYFRATFIRVLVFVGVSVAVSTPVLLAAHIRSETDVAAMFAEMFIITGMAATVLLTAYHREMLARRNFREIQRARAEHDEADRLAELALADSEARSNFLAAVGSEFEWPVRRIVERAQTGDGALSERLEGYMVDIRRSARRMERTVQNVMAVSGAKPVASERLRLRFDLARTVDAALLTLAEDDVETGPVSFVDATDGTGFVLAEEDAVREIVVELLKNALIHGAPDTPVHCRISQPATGTVRLTLVNEGPELSLEDSERAFEPFVQLDDRFARAQEGMGLGLTFARALAQSQGLSLSLQPLFRGEIAAILDLPAAGHVN